MRVCGWSAALLAGGGGGERGRKRSERGKETQRQRERSKAFTGTKHAVSIS